MEIGIVLIIALIVFGPKKLPDLGKSLGKGIREFKGSISGEDEPETPTHSVAIEPPPIVNREGGPEVKPAAKTPA
ncbi:MAG TPA: twin-arginine translocase TatA/TatE family subunit [Solirubrobacterales bacterium]|nr:twin-arginine translocase TatA/TatE family subunit [Solirubrobacterales bacterium]